MKQLICGMVLCLVLTQLVEPNWCTATEPSRRPNILIAISDDQSWPHAGVYGAAELQTPAFDRVASAGVLFENGFAASPGCSPSRAALLTGLHTWQIRQAGTHASSFPADLAVFPDLLEQSGYWVGYTGKAWGPGNWKISGRKRNPAGPQFAKRRLKEVPAGISKVDYAGNFRDFLDQRSADQPFLFWYGATEPHRVYKQGLGKQLGKNLRNVAVPGFLPDVPEIRSDLLDYYAEIEWFDQHLARMLNELDEMGELENTLVIVTADNGMPFPRAKANCYEHGIHVPLAISWPAQVPGQRVVTDPVGFVDLTATILAAGGVENSQPGQIIPGRSLLPLLRSDKQGRVEPQRQAVFAARERHSSSRYNNWTYPQRAMRTDQYLLIRNFRPERWPAGDPQKYDSPGKLGPMHGGYHDIDACPSFSFLIEQRNVPEIARFFHLAVEKRPAVELFDIRSDPDCLDNLASKSEFAGPRDELLKQFNGYLEKTGDPRLNGQGDVYETYRRFSRIRQFPEPE